MSNKKTDMNKNLFPLFTLILSVNFLAVIIYTCVFFQLKFESISNDTPEIITVTEYIYIDKEDDDTSISTGNDNIDKESFLIKEHSGQIGIFSLKTGEILYVIERYTKTLPETDRRLLQEGFVVIGISGIYSVIEDYTG